MMNWYFDLTPSGNSMAYFATRKPSNYGISEDTWYIPMNFCLTSIHFENEIDSENVVKMGKFVVALLKGYSILIDRECTGFYPSLRALYFKNKKVTFDNYSSVNFNTIDDLLGPEHSGYTNIDFIDKAFSPGFFRDILIYASSGWNLINLYKIGEDLKSLVKREGDDENKFRDFHESKRFGALCNNKSISGYDSRHGSKVSVKTYNGIPMKMEEASEYIKGYLNAVLNEYYQMSIPTVWGNGEDFSLTAIFES